MSQNRPAIAFSSLQFGLASAEQESSRAPQLLLEGYYDVDGFLRRALDDDRFVFLGYKGSGKSAIGQRLKLQAEENHDLFVTNSFLSDFPYTSFKKIIAGEAEPEAKYPTAWSWLLLLSLLSSFLSDAALKSDNPLELERTAATLRKMNLLPAPSLKEMALVSSKRAFKASIPSILEASAERIYEGQDLQMLHLVQLLKRVVLGVRTPNRHFVILDGLDDVLSLRDVQYQSLAALLLEVWRLNLSLQEHGSSGRILLLCRTDLFERLPAANKNKWRQDSAVHLDWYHDPRDPSQSHLIGLVDVRASLSGYDGDTIRGYFPHEVAQRDPKKYLLELTRHTPRDFIQLLGHIQRYAGAGRLTVGAVMSGSRDYGINYLVPEIQDELVGYVSREISDVVFPLVGSIRKREFTFSQLEAAARSQPRFADLDLKELVELLFECSAIGNVSTRPTGNRYLYFKYRNRHSHLRLDEPLLLHRGLWAALNLR